MKSFKYKESARDRQEKLKMFEQQLNIKVNSLQALIQSFIFLLEPEELLKNVFTLFIIRRFKMQ